MKRLGPAMLCLPLAACGAPEGYPPDIAMMNFRANQQCARMVDGGATCAGDLIAAAPRARPLLWED